MDEGAGTVLLTGGTGFIGSEILKRLLARGHRVRCLVRPGSANNLPRHERIEPAEGRVQNAEQVLRAAEGCSAAIHVVGILRSSPENTFECVHVTGTANIVAACREHGVRRVVHMSALGVEAGIDTPYFHSKHEAEERVRGAESIEWTILRPSIVHGPRGDFMMQMVQMVDRPGPVPLVGSGDAPLQLVWVEDVAEIFCRALERPATAGQAYAVVGPEVWRLKDFYKTLARVVLGRHKWTMPVPAALVKAGAWAAEKVLANPPVTPDELKMLLGAEPADAAPMREAFEVEPARFEPALRGYAEQLREAAGVH